MKMLDTFMDSKSVTAKIALLVTVPIVLILIATMYSLSSTVDVFHKTVQDRDAFDTKTDKVRMLVNDMKDQMLAISDARVAVQQSLQLMLLNKDISQSSNVRAAHNKFKKELALFNKEIKEIQVHLKDAGLISAQSVDAKSIKAYDNKNDQGHASSDGHGATGQYMTLEEERALFSKLKKTNGKDLAILIYDSGELEKIFVESVESNKRTMTLARNQAFGRAVDNFITGDMPKSKAIDDLVHHMSKVTHDLANDINKASHISANIVAHQTEAEMDMRKWVTDGVLVVVSILIALAAVYFSNLKFSKPLRILSKIMMQASQGKTDMVIPPAGKDEIGDMTHSLEAFVKVFKSMNGVVTQIDSASQQQAAATEQLAATCEQMTATSEATANNATQAKDLAQTAREHAENGAKVVGETISAMSELQKSSKKVADIVGVINDISFQTNLLALNAAIEAERAGEQGRGFAVVATEVQKLAQKSSDAVKEIHTLIKDSLDRVDESTTMVNESGNALEGIFDAIKKVDKIVADISAAAAEQDSGIKQMNAGVMQIDESAQKNATVVQSVAVGRGGSDHDTDYAESASSTVTSTDTEQGKQDADWKDF